MTKFENISASYDIGIAKEFGIPCAVLLNKLLYLDRYSGREDGFSWKTAKELEEELGLTKNQQTLAIEKLEKANIIETKNTYIVGTQVKCKHFKITETFKSEMLESGKSDFMETIQSVNNSNTLVREKEYNKLYSSKRKNGDKPTLDEIRQYIYERNSLVDAECFYNYYESNGWKVGRNPMKDWKACIRTWERNDILRNKKNNNNGVIYEQI